MEGENTDAVRLDGLTKSYQRGKIVTPVLSSVSLIIPVGHFVTITGPSGSGKSTLLKIISGLIKPDSGIVRVHGKSLHTMRDASLARFRNQTTGIVFQDYNLIPHCSALENVMLPLKIAGLARSEQKKRASIALRSVGLSGLAGAKATEMSGGQQQRIAIARSIVMKPRLLVADEPTGNLDTKTGADIMRLLKTIQNKLGTTIIMVTHNPELAQQSDMNIHIVDGRIVGGEMG